MKTCRVCGKSKLLNRFEGTRKTCKDCRNERRKTYGSRSGPGLKLYNLKRLYGMAPEQYEIMLLAQNGLCKICQRPDDSRWKRLAVDHCHATGKIRGLLCAKCNKGLGQFNDNTSNMQRAIAYLEENK